MGGVRKFMPVTFATYAIGMLSLSGFPLLFSGFWSKDEILHSARLWRVSHWPFYLGLFGALLTAFYMTRQVLYVFFGNYRGRLADARAAAPGGHSEPAHGSGAPHESPPSMTIPLGILAVCSVLLGFIGTPSWPWFQRFLAESSANREVATEGGVLTMMLVSTAIVLIGIGLGYRLYGRKPISSPEQKDVLETLWPNVFNLLKRKYYVDEAYEWAVVGLNAWWSRACDWLDRWVWSGVVQLIGLAAIGLAWVDRLMDEFVINGGFDEVCQKLKFGGRWTSRLQDGQVQHYLRVIGLGMTVLILMLIWGCRSS